MHLEMFCFVSFGSARRSSSFENSLGVERILLCNVVTRYGDAVGVSVFDGYQDGETLTTHWEDPSLPAQQWPGLGQDGDGTCGPGGQGRRRRTDDRDRRARESPKELTWEERIRKGAVQKERVEQRGYVVLVVYHCC